MPFHLFVNTGMASPNETCAAGYFCRRNATSATPKQGEDANICPVGHYCPDNTGEPFNCPKGTYGNDTGTDEPRGAFNEFKTPRHTRHRTLLRPRSIYSRSLLYGGRRLGNLRTAVERVLGWGSPPPTPAAHNCLQNPNRRTGVQATRNRSRSSRCLWVLFVVAVVVDGFMCA